MSKDTHSYKNTLKVQSVERKRNVHILAIEYTQIFCFVAVYSVIFMWTYVIYSLSYSIFRLSKVIFELSYVILYSGYHRLYWGVHFYIFGFDKIYISKDQKRSKTIFLVHEKTKYYPKPANWAIKNIRSFTKSIVSRAYLYGTHVCILEIRTSAVTSTAESSLLLQQTHTI